MQHQGMSVSYGGVNKRYSKGLTSRRCLLTFGLGLSVLGIVGFFVDTQAGDLYDLGTGQSIAYLIVGLASLLVGEVWGSDWKRAFLGLEGLFFLVVGIAGFAIAGGDSHDLGIFNVENPWENVVHLLLGLIFLGTALFPRRFRDYSFGSSVSD